MRSTGWLAVGVVGVMLAACRADVQPEPVPASETGSGGDTGSPWHASPACPGQTVDQTLTQSRPCLYGTGYPAGAPGSDGSGQGQGQGQGQGGGQGQGQGEGQGASCSPDREPPQGLPKDQSLWPPNGAMHTVRLAECVDVTDACDPAPSAWFTSVATDELGSLRGTVGGAFELVDCQTVKVRAERSATGDGRVYTLGWEAVDAAGNLSQGTCLVTVPLEEGGTASLTEDGDGQMLIVDGCGSAPARR